MVRCCPRSRCNSQSDLDLSVLKNPRSSAWGPGLGAMNGLRRSVLPASPAVPKVQEVERRELHRTDVDIYSCRSRSHPPVHPTSGPVTRRSWRTLTGWCSSSIRMVDIAHSVWVARLISRPAMSSYVATMLTTRDTRRCCRQPIGRSQQGERVPALPRRRSSLV